MDDLTFSARRATSGATARAPEPAEADARFRALVQSPLRAGILRYLHSRQNESFDVEALMQTFGRLKLDVENCVRELADSGVARKIAEEPPHTADRSEPALADQLRSLPRTTPPSARKIVAVGPALPRNDRARREDAIVSSGSGRPPSPTSPSSSSDRPDRKEVVAG